MRIDLKLRLVRAALSLRATASQCVTVDLGEHGDIDTLNELGLDLWEATEDAEKLFSNANIRPTSIEEVVLGVICGEKVVGASTLGYSTDSFTFSVAIDPGWRRKGIARGLVIKTMQLAEEEAESYGIHEFKVWVVNPHMVPLLESLGFETEYRGWSPDSPPYAQADLASRTPYKALYM